MTYYRQNTTIPDKHSTQDNRNSFGGNKENVPLNSLTQQRHNVAFPNTNKPSLKKDPMPSHNYTRSHSQTLEEKMESLGSNIVNISCLETSKEIFGLHPAIKEEKNNLLNEFKGLKETIQKKAKEIERKAPARRHSISRTDKSDKDNNNQRETCGSEGEFFHNQIFSKIGELNMKYEQLAHNISKIQKNPTWEQFNAYTGNSRTSLNSANTIDTRKQETNEDRKSLSRTSYGGGDRDRKLMRAKTETFETFNTEEDKDKYYFREKERERDNMLRDKIENDKKRERELREMREKELERKETELKDKAAFIKDKEEQMRKKQDEDRELKLKKEEVESQRRMLLEFEAELMRRNQEIDERTKALEANEREFEELTERLEKQSEDLTNQRSEFNKSVELFTARLNKFEQEKEEFLKYEREFNEKNIELRNEQERLRLVREQARTEQEMAEKRCKEIMKEYEQLNEKKKVAMEKEEEIFHKERTLDERLEKLEEDADALNKEREEFINLVTIAETRLKEREDELNQREVGLDERRDKYDDFDLKLLGMKLNEEVWQKRRDIEVDSLQEEIKKIRDREKQLKKREEKLKKIEEERFSLKIDNQREKQEDIVVDESISGRTGTNPDQPDLSLNDKSLFPLSARTYKTDVESRQPTDN